MSTSVLARLKVKPVPNKVEQVKVRIAEPATEERIEIQTKLLDKTMDNIIDRAEFIKKLRGVVQSNKIKEVPPEPIITKPTVKKAKKLGKKLKLSLDEDRDETGKPVKDMSVTTRRTPKPDMNVIADDIDMEKIIGDAKLTERLPDTEKKVLLRANAYYMNNREKFVNFTSSLFRPYKEELDNAESTISCDKPDDAKFALLTHQKIVRDYLNIYTPYRGLLLYHGLGSGKTCSSIAIAEGMKTDKQIVVMKPASIRMNYLQELKNCGDTMYKTNQHTFCD